MAAGNERETQRLLLTRPLPALLNGQNALVLDIGAARILVEHRGAFPPGTKLRLSFVWENEELEFDCELQRSSQSAAADTWQSWMTLTRAIGSSQDRMEELIARYVGHLLAAQRANAIGAGAHMPSSAILLHLGDARRGRSRGYIRYKLADSTWSSSFVTSREQAPDGFTVAAYEDPQELEVLCRAYERADEDGRQLIRLVAELSAMDAT